MSDIRPDSKLVFDEMALWIRKTRPEYAVKKMEIIPTFSSVIAEMARLSTTQPSVAIRAVLADALPAERKVPKSDLAACRYLCRLESISADTTDRWNDAAAHLDHDHDHAGSSLQKSNNACGVRLVELATRRLIDHEMDFRATQAGGTIGPVAPDLRPFLDFVHADPPLSDTTSPGLIRIELEVDLALNRHLLDVYARSAPEIPAGFPLMVTLTDLLLSDDHVVPRLILIEATAGGGKSSLLLAAERRLLEDLPSALSASDPALLPVRIELPLQGKPVVAAVEDALGSNLLEVLRSQGSPDGVRLALLVDGADQDGRWTHTSTQLTALMERDWVGTVVVTGRPGSMDNLRLPGLARLTAAGSDESFGPIELALQPLTFKELVFLARSLAKVHRNDDAEADAIVWSAIRSLRSLDSSLGIWLRNPSLEEALRDWEKESETYAKIPGFFSLGRTAVTPFIALLATLVHLDPGRSQAIESEVDLLNRVMEYWREREAQRIDTFRQLGTEMSASVAAQTLEKLVEIIGHRLRKEPNMLLTDTVVTTTIENANVPGVSHDNLPVWTERLRTCGFFDLHGGHNPTWRASHPRFAEFSSARYLVRTRQSVESLLEELWGLVRQEMNEALPAITTSEIQQRIQPTGAPSPERWKWSGVLRLAAELCRKDDAAATSEAIERMAGEARDEFEAVGPMSSDLATVVCWLGCATELRLPTVAHLARSVMASISNPAEQIAKLRELLREIEQDAERGGFSASTGGEWSDVDWKAIERPLQLESWVADTIHWDLDESLYLGDENDPALTSAFTNILERDLSALETEVRDGPSPGQAMNRAWRLADYVDEPPWAARYLNLVGDPDEDPYVVAGVVVATGSVSEHLADWSRLLKRPGRWNGLARYYLDWESDINADIPTLATNLVDSTEYEAIVQASPFTAHWLAACILPPISMCPPEDSTFWISERPALAQLRDAVERILVTVGMDRADLFSLNGALRASPDWIDWDASDATREAAATWRTNHVGDLRADAAITEVVTNARLPFVTRVWAARVLMGSASSTGLVDEIQAAGDSDFQRGSVGYRSNSSWLRRYSLAANVPRDELLGELNITDSPVSRQALAAKQLVAASRKGPRGVKAAYARLVAARSEFGNDFLRHDTDAFDRAVVISGQLQPRIIRDLIASEAERLGSRYTNPGNEWELGSQINWVGSATRSPWGVWLRQAQEP